MAPILFGIDKFFNWMVTWERYLWPEVANWSNANPESVMDVVVVIEIAAGVVVLLVPRVGSLVVTGWLGDHRQPRCPMPGFPSEASTTASNGTTSLYAGLNLASGEVISSRDPATPGLRSSRRFLKLIIRTVPEHLQVHVLLHTRSGRDSPSLHSWLRLCPHQMPSTSRKAGSDHQSSSGRSL